MAISLTKQLRQAKGTNNEVLQGVYCLATPSVTYKPTVSSSVDPFAGKTNKYAESKVISVTTLAKACHIRFGASDVGACTTSYYCIPADTTEFFAIDDDAAYVRLLENASAATVFVTEIY